MDKETEKRINRPIPYAEFPKMKHHPDGRTALVNSESEESALGGEWCPNPAEALKIRAERDAADEKRVAAQIAKGK
jgi:hypothetical protein